MMGKTQNKQKMQNKQKRLGNKGFSLVELIVVIAIMAVLVGILAPILLNNIPKAKESKDISALDTVYTAILNAYGDEEGNTAFDTTTAYKTGKIISLTTVLSSTSTDKFTTLVKEYAGMSTLPTLTGNVKLNNTGTAALAVNTNIKFIIINGKVTVALTDAADGTATADSITVDHLYYGDKSGKAYLTGN